MPIRIINRTLPGLALFVALLLAIVDTHAASVFDLSGHAGAGTSYNFTDAGLNLTATASADDQPALVHQTPDGLGIVSDASTDLPHVDALGLTEILWLNFSSTVSLQTIGFAEVDLFGDKVRILDHQGNPLSDFWLSPGDGSNQRTLDLPNLGFNFVGASFGFTLTDTNDAWRVLSVTAETAHVPTPAALPAGLLVLTIAAFRRRCPAA